MAITSVYIKEHKWAFYLDEKALRKIAEKLGGGQPLTRISADCKGDFRHAFPTIDDLIEYENPSSRSIKRIHFTMEGRGKVTLRTDLSITSEIELGGELSKIALLSQEIEDIIRGSQRWWWPLARLHLGFVLTLTYFSVSMFGIVHLLIKGGAELSGGTKLPLEMSILYFLVGGIASVLIMYCGSLLHRFKQFMFPPAVFATGQQKQINEDRNIFRFWLLTTLAVGALSFIGAVYSKLS